MMKVHLLTVELKIRMKERIESFSLMVLTYSINFSITPSTEIPSASALKLRTMR